VLIAGPRDERLYKLVRLLIRIPFRLLFRMRIEGIENVPTHGAVLLAVNHVSNIDPVFIGVAAPRQAHFMAKSELWKSSALGHVVEGLSAFPVRRGEADREAIRTAVGYLSDGCVVGIFPEGTRQRAGRLGTALPGFALLALREGVTTIPVALSGTDRIARGGIPRLPRVSVTFGASLDVGVEGLPRGERHQEIGARWMTRVGAMLGHVPASSETVE